MNRDPEEQVEPDRASVRQHSATLRRIYSCDLGLREELDSAPREPREDPLGYLPRDRYWRGERRKHLDRCRITDAPLLQVLVQHHRCFVGGRGALEKGA